MRSEGLEVWDEVSHFNAKKLELLQARQNPDRTIRINELVATLKDLYKDEYNLGSLDDPVLTGFSDDDSEKAGDGEKRLAMKPRWLHAPNPNDS